MVEMDRCKTGVKRLDSDLNGGFPVGSTVLVSGSSGVGKTIFSMQFLINGAKMGEKGIFFTATEPISTLKRHHRSFGFFDESIIESGKLTILDIWNISDRLGLDPFTYDAEEAYIMFEVIRDITKKLHAKRLVLDSITSLCYRLPTRELMRDFIFTLGAHLAAMRCTTVLTSEIPPRRYMYSDNAIEEFISDGIIFLGDYERGSDLIRTLQLVKMRGIAHDRTKFVLNISPENGAELTPMFKSNYKEEIF